MTLRMRLREKKREREREREKFKVGETICSPIRKVLDRRFPYLSPLSLSRSFSELSEFLCRHSSVTINISPPSRLWLCPLRTERERERERERDRERERERERE
jgi:hypothetical protein